ncbi:MAG: hypothetical protein NTW66_00290 [Candidatus Magasanikbacteria bacterium]|nr:hypothetical protein [Candidatus Magasanikbacteria bacterium]
MSVKQHSRGGNVDRSWQKRRADAFGKVSDGLVDVANAKKQKISDRLKATGLKEKKVYKAKLGDDMRAFEYAVTKIDRLEGDVWLKSERGKVRKARVFDAIFGPVERPKHKGKK